jgi:hypothetical protein
MSAFVDPGGNRFYTLGNKEVNGTLYGQELHTTEDFAQWLTNIGHRVLIENKSGELIPMKRRVVQQHLLGIQPGFGEKK